MCEQEELLALEGDTARTGDCVGERKTAVMMLCGARRKGGPSSKTK